MKKERRDATVEADNNYNKCSSSGSSSRRKDGSDFAISTYVSFDEVHMRYPIYHFYYSIHM